MDAVCMTDNIHFGVTSIGQSKEMSFITAVISRNVLITLFQVSAL